MLSFRAGVKMTKKCQPERILGCTSIIKPVTSWNFEEIG